MFQWHILYRELRRELHTHKKNSTVENITQEVRELFIKPVYLCLTLCPTCLLLLIVQITQHLHQTKYPHNLLLDWVLCAGLDDCVMLIVSLAVGELKNIQILLVAMVTCSPLYVHPGLLHTHYKYENYDGIATHSIVLCLQLT